MIESTGTPKARSSRRSQSTVPPPESGSGLASHALVAAAVVFTCLGLLAMPVTRRRLDPEPLGSVIDVADCTQNELSQNDDGSSGSLALGFSAKFGSQSYDHLYVNNNGNVTFGGPVGTYTPSAIPSLGAPMIAPFWADVDTRGGTTVKFGYGETTFNGHPAFCVNWVDVGYFSNHYDKKNSFQLLLVNRSDRKAGAFDAVFNYDKIQWESGDASGGSGGLGGTTARAGYLLEPGGKAWEVPGSGVAGAFLDGGSNSLKTIGGSGRLTMEFNDGRPPTNKTLGKQISRGAHDDPVDVATGNFFFSARDLPEPEGAPDLGLSRTYNSLSEVSGVLGANWMSQFDTNLYAAGNGTMELAESDGTIVVFPSSGSGWSTPTDYQATLTYSTATSQYTLTRPDGTRELFDAGGRLVERRHPLMPAMTVAYAPSAGTYATATQAGHTLTLYDNTKLDAGGATVAGSDGIVDRATDSDLKTVTFDHARSNASITLASASAPHLQAAETVTPRSYTQSRYVYQSGRAWMTDLFQEIEPGREHAMVHNTLDSAGRVTTQVSADGDTTNFNYGQRRVSGSLVPTVGYTTTENVASHDWTIYHYDPAGQLLDVTDPNNAASGKTWNAGQPSTFSDRLGTNRTNTYDAAGRLKTVTETNGTTSHVIASYTYKTAETAAGAAQDQRVATAVDSSGVTTTYTYTGASTLPDTVSTPCDPQSTAVSCPAGNLATTSYVYGTGDQSDLVVRETDADGYKTEYTYYADRSLHEEKIFPNGTTPLTTTYTYSSAGTPGWSETDPRVASTMTVTTPLPATTIYKYDASDRLIEVRDPLFDATTHKATRYTYFANGDPRTVTDPFDHTTTYQLLYRGDSGFPTADVPSGVMRVESMTDADGISVQTLFDQSGDAVQVWNGKLGSPSTLAKTVNSYTALGRLDHSTDPMGVITWHQYDADGNQTAVVTGPSATDPNHTRTTHLGPLGRVDYETGPTQNDPDGTSVQAKTSYTYDSAGRVSTKIEGDLGPAADKLMTSYVYDAAGRLWRTIEHRDGDVTPADAAVIHAGDHVVETRYTLAGRTKKTVEPGADNPAFDWSGADSTKRVTTYGYDQAGRQTSVTDPRGKTTNTAYTPESLIDTVTSPTGRVTDYGYDSAGQLTSVTTPSGLGAGQPTTVSATTTYHPDGSIATETDPHIVVPGVADPSTRSYGYTPGGRLQSVTDADSKVVSYTYDDRGNRSTKTSTDDGGTARVESWNWDLDDNLVSHVVPPPRAGASSQTTSYVYDYNDAVDSTSANNYGNLASVTDPTGRTEARSYYNDGALRSRTWTQSGATTKSSTEWHNSRGFTTKMRDTVGSTNTDNTYTVDRVGQRLTSANSLGTTSYQWDDAGNVYGLTYVDGAKFRYTHLPTGQIYEYLGWSSGSGTYVLVSNYTYNDDGTQTNEWIYTAGGSTRSSAINPAGNVSTFTEVMKRPDSTWETYTAAMTYRADQRLGTEQVNGGSTATLTYDNAGQLTGKSGADPVSYTYGTRGNRLTQTAGSTPTTYTTNPNGSIASATTGSTVVSYAYDDAGRRTTATTKVSGSTTKTVSTSYDARGKPDTITTVAGSSTTTETRTYDGRGLLSRFAVTASGTTHTYDQIWDSTPQVPRVLDLKLDGSQLTRMSYGNELINYKNGFYPMWYLQNAHDSIINPVNNANMAAGPTAYDPFGTPTGADYLLPAGYRSEEQIGGLINLRNRDYDPVLGQFTSQDPLDGVDGTPTNANPYQYADNDPYDRTDPLGLRAGDCEHNGKRKEGCDAEKSFMDRARDLLFFNLKSNVVGMCGDVEGDYFFVDLDVQGCVIDDGSRLARAFYHGTGYTVALTAGASVGYIYSNAKDNKDFSGPELCGAVSGGPGWFIGGEVCYSLTKKYKDSTIDEVLEHYPGDTVDPWSIFMFTGVGAGTPWGDHLNVGKTSVRQIVDYPDWMGPILPKLPGFIPLGATG